jgi:quinol monooxygenase YgiN
MIIITGDFIAKQECIEEALAESRRHVEHSRSESGCISHAVYQDPENPCRLFFYEQWTNQEVIAVHFAEPSSQAFVAAIRELAASPPNLEIFSAQKIK